MRPDVVQREDRVEVADSADDGHDDRFVGDPTGDELAIAVSLSGDLSLIHDQIGLFRVDSARSRFTVALDVRTSVPAATST